MDEGREGLKKAINERKNGFEYAIKSFDVSSIIGRRNAFVKLTTLYKLSKDKKTAHDLILEILQKKGLSFDEWIEELGQVEINERVQKHRREALYMLEKAKEELEKGKSIDEVFSEFFVSIRKFRDIQIKTFDEDDELLKGFDEDEAISFSFLPDLKLYPDDILLISAKTKSGKTTVALNMFNEALEQGKKSFYATYEFKGQLFELFIALNLRKDRDSVKPDHHIKDVNSKETIIPAIEEYFLATSETGKNDRCCRKYPAY